MTNAEIASAFGTIAKILDLKGENPFRVRAYQRAEMTIGGLSQDLRDLYAAGGTGSLKDIPGIGEDLSQKIEEMIQTGKLEYLVKLEKEVPAGLFEIMQVPGMGPKKTKFVWETFQVEDIQALDALAKSGKLDDLKGWGPKSVENILKGIQTKKSLGSRMAMNVALELAESLVETLKRTKLCEKLEIAGSLRRRKETIGDIDILATSKKPEAVMEAFCTAPQVKDVIARGETKSSILLTNGIQADLRVVEADVFGAALHYFTGSKEHNIRVRSLALKKGVTISEYGVYEGTPDNKGKRIAARTEADVFKTVGLKFIEPELREDRGEVDAAAKGELPDLIVEEDLKGDLHLHSQFSDGSDTMLAMAKAALEKGFEYIALTDHASAMGMVKGIKEANVGEYVAAIDAVRKKVPKLRILAGTEVDIQEDGSLYLSDAALAKLEWVVASIHGKFQMERSAMTERLIRAIEHPAVTLLGHPTARLLLQRPGIEFDVEAVFAAAKKHGVALELNASVYRLDLSDVLCKKAKDMGIPICIDSDAHKAFELDYRYGISQARRAWLTKEDVLNCLSLKEFEKKLKS
jgi:DNA polymerase (family 10)